MLPITLIADGQSMFWVYFDLFSNRLTYVILVLQLVAALVPDLVLKVLENLINAELISKQKRIEKLRKDNYNLEIASMWTRDNKARESFF